MTEQEIVALTKYLERKYSNATLNFFLMYMQNVQL